jgi:hypothetical protein
VKHLRSDYDTIQDMGQTRCGRLHMGIETATSIDDDEPIFLLRAKDAVAPIVVAYWAKLVEDYGGDRELAASVKKWADEMVEWQNEHGKKMPDAPADKLRM